MEQARPHVRSHLALPQGSLLQLYGSLGTDEFIGRPLAIRSKITSKLLFQSLFDQTWDLVRRRCLETLRLFRLKGDVYGAEVRMLNRTRDAPARVKRFRVAHFLSHLFSRGNSGKLWGGQEDRPEALFL